MPPELNLPQIELNFRVEDLENLNDGPNLRDTYTYHRADANNHTFTGGEIQVVDIGDPINTNVGQDLGRGLQNGGLVTDPQFHIHYEYDPPEYNRVADAVDALTFAHTYRTEVGDTYGTMIGDTNGDGLPENRFVEMTDQLHRMVTGIDLAHDPLRQPGAELNEMAERVNNGTATIHQTDGYTATTFTADELLHEVEMARSVTNDCASNWGLNDLELFETLKPRIKNYIEELLQQKGYIIGKVPEETSEIPVG